MTNQYRIPIPIGKKDWLISILNWLDAHFDYFSCFQNHQIQYPEGAFPFCLYAGRQTVSAEKFSNFEEKQDLVGVLSYDYKNQIEKLSSLNPALVDCPEVAFFLPSMKIEKEGEVLLVHCDEELGFSDLFDYDFLSNTPVKVVPLTDRRKYFQDIQAIRKHIEEGDMYELNYCMAFSFEGKSWSPVVGFYELMKVSPMPFSGLFKFGSKFLIAASPERFLKRKGREVIAQPIKGTIKRGNDPVEDKALAEQLLESEKERAENLMIVDLMRNDLSKISETGAVKVIELFGVYPFSKVHQMISTVGSTLKEKMNFWDIIHATFPMGSMTGAPKIKCMELIERYENFKRGWFSGAFGILQSNGDFDFNVVIRSIVFDSAAQKGYFAVGSAITYDADAAYEWEECHLKAAAILEVLEKRS
ncbi:MAG: anthranilate synthase component I family protein [Cecembia sp.]